MDPAFSSDKQAASFATLLAAILLLPVLAGEPLLPDRAEIYKSIPWRFGGHPCFQKTIFEGEKPLDIALIGSSHIWSGVDPVYLSAELTKSLGRESVVRTLGWNWPGFDALYFTAEDLLENRKVKLLVVNNEFTTWVGRTQPHRLASRWFRLGDNGRDLAGLGLEEKAVYYASSVLGMPRNLLGMTRASLPIRPSAELEFSPEKLYRTEDPEIRLGALRTELNYFSHKTTFLPFKPRMSAEPQEIVVWSDENRERFGTSGPNLPKRQLHFVRKLADLARKHNATLLFIHLPSLDDTGGDRILESAIWPEILGENVRYAGVPPAALFRGMTEKEIAALFYDPKHLNRNGQEYFTPIITPIIIQIFNEISGR